MTALTAAAESPVQLVRAGLVAIDDSLRIRASDAHAQAMLGSDALSLEGQLLLEIITPEHEADVLNVEQRTASSYVGTLQMKGAQLLVSFSDLPSGRFATLTSVNEYLIESQALARVKLRNTVESIIAGFAHEVRNPLASILSLTEAALQQNPQYAAELVRIPGLVARVESLIQYSLAYSRPKPPKRQLHRPSFLIDRASMLLRAREAAAELDLPEDDRGVSPVMVDLLQAEQILVNLLENALDVGSKWVRVKLSEGQTGAPSVCIEVTDDGPGVTADTAQRIFDPFFTTKAHGTGLGLAIARDLARLNGGDLELANHAPQGAAFRLYLPSTPAPIRGNW